MATTALAMDISVCVRADDLPAHDHALLGGAPVPLQPLRLLDDGSVRSAIVHLPGGWESGDAEPLDATTQMFLLSGALSIAGNLSQDSAFMVVPAGAVPPTLAADSDCRLIVILDPPGPPRGIEPVIVADVFAIPPFTPTIAGRRLDGFERRVLWIDPDSGADTRLLRVPAGFRGPGPNWHPVNEEIFCLDGDIQPDETRPMRAGSFLWNPANSIHGFDEHTVGGCLLLEWHDGDWALTPVPDAVRPAPGV